MERLENRHNSDTQTAIFEETSDTLSIADMLKRTLERTITSGEDMTRSLGQTARNQKLPPATLIKFLIAAEGGSLAKELHRAGIDATPAAVSQRRRQIPPAVFRKVFLDFTSSSAYGQPNRGYKGYRVLACDGTAVNMARNPNAPSFVCNNSAPKGYNQLHLSPLFDIYDRTYFDAVIQPAPHKDEPGALVEMLKRNDFNRKTIIVLDRGYESYNVMAHLMNTPNVYFVLRVKHNHSAMREIARLPMLELDCDIAFTISTTQTNEDKRNRHIYLPQPKKSKPGSTTRRARWDFPSPYTMRLRVVRFQLDNGNFETLATSLPRTFTIDDLKEIYHRRWGIETSFRDLKYSAGLINLHGKRDDFVEQEIYAALTAFNFTSRIVQEVVVQQPTDGLYAYAVNFKMAVTLCKEFLNGPDITGKEVMQKISRHTVPIRPGRQDERNLRAKGFGWFTYRIAA